MTATNSANCISKDSIKVVHTINPPPICLVTVDSSSQHNILIWNKAAFTDVDSFIIYRETITNNYKRIGAVPFDSLSLFIDTVRTKYFPNTGNPNAGTYRYKISLRDSCGNYSPLSPFHNTIYMTNNNGSFSWAQLYTIEGGANPVNAYVLMRDDNSTGNWHAVSSVAGTQQNVIDPDYSTWKNTASWRAETQWNISCTPTIIKYPDPAAMTSNAFSSSHSNTYKDALVAVNQDFFDNRIILSPNPGNGIFSITSDRLISKVEVVNMLGEVVYTKIEDSKAQARIELDLSRHSKGIYYITISSEKGRSTGKLILQ